MPEPIVASPAFAGRTAIVTGGGRGLGRVMALALVAAGVDVAITGARSREELDETRDAAEALGKGRCIACIADVSSAREMAVLHDTVIAEFGHIDILVNNAARGPFEVTHIDGSDTRPRFWEGDPDAWLRMVKTNVGGVFLLTRLCVPGMIAAGHGRIINISTSRPTMIRAGAGPYGAGKAMLEASSRIWAEELAGTGVTVNVLLPGGPADTAFIPADTAFIAGAIGSRSNHYRAGKEALGQEGNVEGGLLPPEIMAAPLLWLASDAAGAVSGRRIVARDWDPDLPFAQALAQAAAPPIDAPHIM